MCAHVLVVEDDATLSNLVGLYLRKDGHTVSTAQDGRSGLAQALADDVDLVVLDLMLPEMDGWEVCRRLREQSQVPIILLTGLDQEQHKIKGLDLGADDYVTKPFSAGELMARVRAHLRRSSRGEAPTSDAVLNFPGLRVDAAGRTVELDGQKLELTPKEFDLLYLMAREPGRVFTHDDLLEKVWQYPGGSDPRTIHTHVLRLRRKLENPRLTYLQTVWGVGFKFEVAPV
ncbi:MAG TPA: response regulator transcription factor [Symbiobacteriaceae bacterium]|jgi:two-component system response regulator ResD|nr:response regulator transcription factor [Symbiobacteriaceae bacterium]